MTDTTRTLAPYNLVLTDSSRAATVNYYGADGKLMLTEMRTRTTSAGLYPGPESSEEYRYDPLGRRILRRARNSLEPAIQRFVWSGDNLLAEMQYPGGAATSSADLERDTASVTGQTGYYGRVLYTVDGALDQPVAVVRLGYGAVDQGTYHSRDPFAMALDWNQRGEVYGQALYSATPLISCGSPSSGSASCVYVLWAALNAYFTCFGCNGYINPNSWGGWFGSITRGQMDGSGKVHKRNRYYDPATGRFTQEDPIGLAGGMNAYGFAGGNPVTYSDPFGLCPGVAAAPTAPCEMIAAVLGEDPSHGAAGWHAIASVIMNRVTSGKYGIGSGPALRGRFGDAALTRQVVTEPSAFVGLRNEQGRMVMRYIATGRADAGFNVARFNVVAAIAENHFTGRSKDTTNGALFFFQDRLPRWGWLTPLIADGRWETKHPIGLQNSQAHNNVFFGPR